MDARDPLRDFVANIFVGRANTVQSRGASRALVVPDGYVDLLWEPGRLPWIAGPDVTPSYSSVVNVSEMIRIQFRRARVAPIVRTDLDQLVNQRVPVDTLWADRRWRDLAQMDRADAAINPILDAIRDRLPRRWEPDIEVETALAGRRSSLSERQLRRRFCREIGYGPATLRRIDRFRRFVAGDAPTVADRAIEAGYADHAHLSRECRRLTGLTPTAFLACG